MKVETSFHKPILDDEFRLDVYRDEKIKAIIGFNDDTIRLDEFDIETLIESLFKSFTEEQQKNIINILLGNHNSDYQKHLHITDSRSGQ